MVFNVDNDADLLAAGYWKPFAVEGAAPSAAYTTAGAYYLACNPAASMKPLGFGVDLSGYAAYPWVLPWSTAPTVFEVVGWFNRPPAATQRPVPAGDASSPKPRPRGGRCDGKSGAWPPAGRLPRVRDVFARPGASLL
jgi:hypothetical protein